MNRRLLAWVPAAAVVAAGLVRSLRGWSDFEGYATVGKLLRAGVYSQGLLSTWPPAFALFAVPLSFLHGLGAAGRLVWALTNLLAFAWACARLWRVAGNGAPWWVAPAAAFVASPFLAQHLEFHQVYMLIFALAVEGFLAAREGSEARAGLALGLAGALKVTPALTLPVFLLRRQWRLCAVAVGAALACSAALALPLGVRGAVAAHWYWLERAAGLRGTHGIRNQSILALVERWTTGEARREEAGLEPVFPMEGRQADRLGKALSCLLLLFACFRMRRADPAVAACVLLPVAVLAVPYAWRSQYVVFAPLLALTLLRLSRGASPLEWALAAPFFLAMPLREPGLIGERAYALLEGAGATCIEGLLLIAATLYRGSMEKYGANRGSPSRSSGERLMPMSIAILPMGVSQRSPKPVA